MSNITEETQKGKLDWILFLVFTVIMVFMMTAGAPLNEWFWLTLPFSLTFLARGMDVM